MRRFIALLRGINVSGQKKIKMSDLKLLFEEMGFKDVQTYIQSGNVIFSSKEISVDKLELKISSSIKRKYGFDVRLVILSAKEIEYVLKNNPFFKKRKYEDKLYVTFLSKIPSDENIEKMHSIDYSPEEYFIKGKRLYLFVPNGYGKAKINNNLIEKKLKVDGTTRNWKTVKTLSELAK